MHEIAATLRSCGLNDREIQVYLVLLGIGQAPASVIARRTGIPKSTVKYACLQLSKKGFLRMIQKDKAHLFMAEEPEKILFIFEREREQVTKRENQMRKIMGPLRQMMCRETVLPAIQFYEGVTGVLEATLAMVRDVPEGGELLQFVRPMTEADARHLPSGITPADMVDRYEEQFQERMRRRIRKRMIASRSPESEQWLKNAPEELREARIVDDPLLPGAPCEILISGNTMLASSAESQSVFAFRLEHPSIVGMYRALFEMAWKTGATR